MKMSSKSLLVSLGVLINNAPLSLKKLQNLSFFDGSPNHVLKLISAKTHEEAHLFWLWNSETIMPMIFGFPFLSIALGWMGRMWGGDFSEGKTALVL